MKLVSTLFLVGVLTPIYNVQAKEVTISFTNLSGADGAALSPILVALSNNTSPIFVPGTTASDALVLLAETGNGAGLAALYGNQNGIQTAVVTASVNGFGPGIYLPGGTGSITLNLDPTKNEYLSFYSMVVPSNDRFIGGQIQLFDSAGQFVGANTTLYGNAIWDAGAVESQIAHAAFLVNNAGDNTPTINGVIQHDSNFSVYSGQLTPAGYSFTNLPTDSTPLLSVSITPVPEPSMAWLFAGAAWVLGLARRKSQ